MDPTSILDRLRRIGLYPSLHGARIRVYGDTTRLPGELRTAINAHRDALTATLRRPEQAIAYDLVDTAANAGWHPSVVEDSLVWKRGEEACDNPMPIAALRHALDHHTPNVISVLRNVPHGCEHRQQCAATGICAAEILKSTCYLTGQQIEADEASRSVAVA